jgi:hypothetical protein
MEVFFDGTSAGGAYGANDSYGTLPLNYPQSAAEVNLNMNPVF